MPTIPKILGNPNPVKIEVRSGMTYASNILMSANLPVEKRLLGTRETTFIGINAQGEQIASILEGNTYHFLQVRQERLFSEIFRVLDRAKSSKRTFPGGEYYAQRNLPPAAALNVVIGRLQSGEYFQIAHGFVLRQDGWQAVALLSYDPSNAFQHIGWVKI